MRHSQPLFLTAGVLAASLSACGGSDDATPPPEPLPVAKSCDPASFASLKLDNASVISAAGVAANSYVPAGSSAPIQNLAAFCKITGQARPTSDSLINFEIWVPKEGWNGKFVTTGNGGYSPAMKPNDMANALRQGYATIGGDTGHQVADGNDFFWGVGHTEKIRDWGTRSVHAITVPGKAIVAQLQGRAITRSYYYGCSTGGHQGYAEVQQYPEDFDGVIAGAPGSNRTALNAEFLWRFLANHATGNNTTPILSNAKVSLITSRAVAACDALDGVTDGVIADPRACTGAAFSVDAMLCTGAENDSCLTADQIAAVKKVYQGPRNARTGAQIYPGQLVGSESGWPSYWSGTAPARSDFWALWAFDNPQWNWWNFDWDRDYTFAQSRLGPLVDQVNPDISAFKARGGKLITFHGWADAVVSPQDTIAYYEQVKTAQGGASLDGFFRLFMAPGMGHCSGGTGPVAFGQEGGYITNPTPANDILMALDQWVDKGVAPDSIIASKLVNGAATATRPLCPYPRKAIYKGSGSTDDASNFICQ